MNDPMPALAQRILTDAGTRMRFIVAIAGPPAAGKSMLAEKLRQLLDQETGKACAAVFPLDGFHFDDCVLEARGQRNRKGAPFTFDVGGYAATLRRIRQGEEEVAIPIFDRSMELSRAGAAIIEPRHRIILTEGNYLLLDEAPWAALRPLYDLCVLLKAPEDILHRRLTQRWLTHGKTLDAAENWIATNDLPNIRHVLAHSGQADVVFNAA